MPQTQAKWYNIRARAAAQGVQSSAEVLIYGDIGASWYGDSVEAKDFVQEIAALDVELLTVRINSFGGSVSDGIAIYNAIKRHKAQTTVVIDGVAASIASLIAMSGDSVEMAENALLMIHAPWGYASGNSADMREFADMLDTWAQAMATSYASKSGNTIEEMLALLTDGQDHWYTAQQALDATFVDTVVSAMPLAASFDRTAIAARFKSMPGVSGVATVAAAAAQPSKEKDMTGVTQPAAPAQPAAKTEAEIQAAGVASEAKRRSDIRAAFKPHTALAGVEDLLAACENDIACSAADANAKLLAHMGKGAQPVAGHIEMGASGRERFLADAEIAIMARAGVMGADGKQVRAASGNTLRGAKLLDIARASLQAAGISMGHMDQRAIVAAAFTQSTSDFPVLLENVMHKTLQTAYAVTPDTWQRFCKIGSVGDFRAHSRYRTGSFGSLDSLNELGEFKNKTIPDGEKATITAGTKGNIINISRQTIINDDLDAFVGLAQMLGRAGKLTIEKDVYALLALNSGMGPTMGDNKALFHADHKNITGAGALSVALIDAMNVLIGSQTDISGNEVLDLRLAVLLCPKGSGGDARVINEAQFDPTTSKNAQTPNKSRGLYRDIVDTARLTGTRVYSFADPTVAPVIEVAFLDGVQEPYLEMENGFDVDGARWKVRLDYATGGIDYRGAVTAAGA